MTPSITIPIARAIGQDAANRQMRKAGRTAWSRADFATAAKVMNGLCRKFKLETP